MRTIIAGSRGTPRHVTFAAIEACPWHDEISVVLSGRCRGPDQHGEEWAEEPYQCPSCHGFGEIEFEVETADGDYMDQSMPCGTCGGGGELERCVEVEPFEVTDEEWAELGDQAGPIRNSRMVACAEALIAVWDGQSSGTKDTIEKAQRAGLRVFVYDTRSKSGASWPSQSRLL